MSASSSAKKLGFKSLRDAARILGITAVTLNRAYNEDRNRFDDLLIGAKNKLNLAQIDFYRECAKEDGVTFEQWYKNKDSI